MRAVPNLHAVLVHFPIGLLATAVAIDIWGVISPSRAFSRVGVALLYVTGSAALAAAYVTGREAAASVLTPGLAHPVVLDHWNAAFVVTLFFGAYALLRLAACTAFDFASRRSRLLVAVAVVGILGLGYVAEKGGELVYRWGVGVAAR